MAALLKRLGDTTRPLLWLDDAAYSTRLLGYGPEIWLDAGGAVAFRRKAVALLHSEVIALPVGEVVGVWLQRNPQLRQSMAAKTRTIAPLRTLLADEGLRARLVDLVRALRSAFPANPLALTLSSPRKWIGDAYRTAFEDSGDASIGADETDAAAVYIAEFLHGFGDTGLDCVLLMESPDAEPASAAEIAWYQPVINLAGHYRWDLGVHLPVAAPFNGKMGGVDFVVAPRALTGVPTGIATPPDFWAGADIPAITTGQFRFAYVPPRSVPEQVLERLEILRRC